MKFAEVVSGLLALFGIAGDVRDWRQKRYAKSEPGLMEKYGDADIVARIRGRKVWIGQTAEQLRDSCGNPLSVLREPSKGSSKETWKWGNLGAGQYKHHVVLEDDIVVSFDLDRQKLY